MTTINVPPAVVAVAGPYPATATGGPTDPTDPVDPPAPTTWPHTAYLTSPADGAAVITGTPQLIVGTDIDSDDDEQTYTMAVQYADNLALTGAVTLTADFDVIDAGATLQADDVMPPVTYWRARILLDGAPLSAWTATQSFTVSMDITAASLPVTWTVDGNAARPIHLWHFDPAGPNIGDTVTIYGQGFPTTRGTLTYGTLDLTVESWKRIAAASDLDKPDRQIAADVVDAEHYEVTFTAPNYNGPGEPLTVGA